MSEPEYYSASRLKTVALCVRKFGWKYITGLPDPSGPAAELGQQVHKTLERWLEDGEPPNLHTKVGKIAQPGLQYLPLPSPVLEVEKEFKIRVGDLYFRGFVDLSYTDTEGMLWVVDHKTTGDFVWALDEDRLREDIQAVLYAKQAIDRFDRDDVTLRWVYYRTRGAPKSQVTQVTMTREEIDERFEQVYALAEYAESQRLSVTDPLQLPPTTSACKAFGGCPYKDRCNLSAADIFRAHKTQEQRRMGTMTQRMKDKTAKRKGKGKTTGRAEVVNPPEGNAATEVEDEELDTKPAQVQGPPKPPKKRGKKGKGKGSLREKYEAEGKGKPAEATEEGPKKSRPLAAVPDIKAEEDAEAEKPEPKSEEPKSEEPKSEEPKKPKKPKKPKAEDKPTDEDEEVEEGKRFLTDAERILLYEGHVTLYKAAIEAGAHPHQIKAADRGIAKLQELLGE